MSKATGGMRPSEPDAFSLVIRDRDKKCRGERYGKPITGWCNDAIAVLDVVRRKECRR